VLVCLELGVKIMDVNWKSIGILFIVLTIVFAGTTAYLGMRGPTTVTTVAQTQTVTQTVRETVTTTQLATVTQTVLSTPLPSSSLTPVATSLFSIIASEGENIRLSRYISGEGVDNIYYCWARVIVGSSGVAERFVPCKPSDFWRFSFNESTYPEFLNSYFIKPKGYQTVSLRSKQVFRYGIYEIRTKLPIIKDGPFFWFGFEHEDLFAGGVIHFQYITSSGSLKAFVGSIGSQLVMDLTEFLPPGFAKEKHWYKIQVLNDYVLYYIDERLRAIAILTSGDIRGSKVLYNYPPFKIGIVRDMPSLTLSTLFDIDGAPDKDVVWPDINPWDIRVAEGRPDVTLYLQFYIFASDSMLAGRKVSSKVVTAPVPGLGDKTITFRINGSGKLVIEASMDGLTWVPIKSYILAENNNTVLTHITESYLLIRLVYEPTSETLIKEASIIIRTT